jgi:putative photosynthetic complex assembly protein 2
MTTALDLGLLALLACIVWWVSTGVILALINRAEHTYRWSMLFGVLMAIGALVAVVATRSVETVEAAVAAFAAAIIVWGAIEMAFLMGYVVGPRREACPRGISAWARFKASWEALAHHELALIGGLALIFALVAGAPNTVAFQTFALLWVMRLSTKLNIFLGVSNAGAELLPRRVVHLATYFGSTPINVLMPFSISAATITVVLLAQAAMKADATAHAATGSVLLATFAALAVLEHWLLVVPLPASSFWPWAGRSTPATTASPKPLIAAISAEGQSSRRIEHRKCTGGIVA